MVQASRGPADRLDSSSLTARRASRLCSLLENEIDLGVSKPVSLTSKLRSTSACSLSIMRDSGPTAPSRQRRVGQDRCVDFNPDATSHRAQCFRVEPCRKANGGRTSCLVKSSRWNFYLRLLV